MKFLFFIYKFFHLSQTIQWNLPTVRTLPPMAVFLKEKTQPGLLYPGYKIKFSRYSASVQTKWFTSCLVSFEIKAFPCRMAVNRSAAERPPPQLLPVIASYAAAASQKAESFYCTRHKTLGSRGFHPNISPLKGDKQQKILFFVISGSDNYFWIRFNTEHQHF